MALDPDTGATEGLLVLLNEPDVLAFIGFCLLTASWLLLPAMFEGIGTWVTWTGSAFGIAFLLVAGARFAAERRTEGPEEASNSNVLQYGPTAQTRSRNAFDAVVDAPVRKPFTEAAARTASGTPPPQPGAATTDHRVGTPERSATPVTPCWTIELLREIEWKHFENLCAGYFEAIGYRAETQRNGFDGGIDIRVFRKSDQEPWMLVQCKAWKNDVGVKEVRELLGVATASKVPCAVFMSTSGFHRSAREFASTAGNIELVDGPLLLERLHKLDELAQRRLLRQATAGDYRTPTCPGCGGKMKHHAERPPYWQCPHPICRKRRVPRIYERRNP